MKKKDSKSGTTLISMIKSDSLKGLGKEYIEAGIDLITDSEAIKAIPFVGSIVSVYNAAGLYREQLFTNKLIRFLDPLSDLSEAERIEMADRLNEDDKFAGKAGERILEIIDRMESEIKPEMTATFLKSFARKEIDFDTLRRLLFSLEKAQAFDIKWLADFSAGIGFQTKKADDPVLLGYVNAGLGMNNGGMDGGTIIPTPLCKLFVKAGALKDSKNDVEENLNGRA